MPEQVLDAYLLIPILEINGAGVDVYRVERPDEITELFV